MASIADPAPLSHSASTESIDATWKPIESTPAARAAATTGDRVARGQDRLVHGDAVHGGILP